MEIIFWDLFSPHLSLSHVGFFFQCLMAEYIVMVVFMVFNIINDIWPSTVVRVHNRFIVNKIVYLQKVFAQCCHCLVIGIWFKVQFGRLARIVGLIIEMKTMAGKKVKQTEKEWK